MTFGERLTELKDESGLTWAEIAHRAGLREPRYLYALASGEREPRLTTINKLAEVFGVEPSTMLPGEGD